MQFCIGLVLKSLVGKRTIQGDCAQGWGSHVFVPGLISCLGSVVGSGLFGRLHLKGF